MFHIIQLFVIMTWNVEFCKQVSWWKWELNDAGLPDCHFHFFVYKSLYGDFTKVNRNCDTKFRNFDIKFRNCDSAADKGWWFIWIVHFSGKDRLSTNYGLIPSIIVKLLETSLKIIIFWKLTSISWIINEIVKNDNGKAK